MGLKRFNIIRHGSSEQVIQAQFVKAGNWVFGTGLKAVGPNGLIDSQVTKRRRPLDPPPKAQREAEYIYRNISSTLEAADSGLDLTVRLDQYYPDARAVSPYHIARKNAMKGLVSPSTSVIVGGLLNTDADMDIQIMAATRSSGFRVGPVESPLGSAPQGSGYTHSLRAGDFIFLAGQLARDETNEIAKEATMPDTQQWQEIPIRLQTDYLVRHRLIPALQASQSGMHLILKAQVYLSHEEDLPAFWQSWSDAFNGKVPPTSIIPVQYPSFRTKAGRLEVNIIAAHESAEDRIVDIEQDVDLLCPGMLAARRLDDLVFVSGLMGIDEEGLIAGACKAPTAPYYDHSAGAQMTDVLSKAELILSAAGSSLDNVVRALHFQKDLNTFPEVYTSWRNKIGDIGLPFSAIQVNPSLFVPDAEVIVDMIAYAPAG